MSRGPQIAIGIVLLLLALVLGLMATLPDQNGYLVVRLLGGVVAGALGFACTFSWGRPYTTRLALGMLSLAMLGMVGAVLLSHKPEVGPILFGLLIAVLAGTHAATGYYPASLPWSEVFGKKVNARPGPPATPPAMPKSSEAEAHAFATGNSSLPQSRLVRLLPLGRQFQDQEWALELGVDRVAVTDADNKVLVAFDRSAAQTRFRFPSFWDSLKHFQIWFDGNLAYQFDVSPKGMNIIKTYMEETTLAGGSAAIRSFLDWGLLMTAGGLTAIIMGVVGSVISQQAAAARPEGGRYYIYWGIVLAGMALVSKGLYKIAHFNRLSRKMNKRAEASVNVPVGGRVGHLTANHLEVEIAGRPVASPWYLYVTALLPLGIPVLTLGGAIPIALGFGLSAACAGVVRRESWSPAARFAAALTLSLTGYAVLLVSIVIISVMQDRFGANQRIQAGPQVAAPLQPKNPGAVAEKGEPRPVQRQVEVEKGPRKPDKFETFASEGRLFIDIRHDPPAAMTYTSTDGSLVFVTQNGKVHRWDVIAGKPISTLDIGSKGFAAFTPDGKVLAVSSVDGQIDLLDTTSGEHLGTLRHPSGSHPGWCPLVFAPDGKRLLSAQDRIIVWHWPTRRILWSRPGRANALPGTLAFSPDGKTVVAAGPELTLSLLSADTGAELAVLKSEIKFQGQNARFRIAGFSPDGHKLVTGGSDGTLRFWDLPARRELRHLSQKGSNHAGATLALSNTLAVAGGDSKIHVIDFATQTERGWLDNGFFDQHGLLVASPPGTQLAVSTQTHLVVVDLTKVRLKTDPVKPMD